MKKREKKNVKIENDKLNMWKLNPKAEAPENWEDSEDDSIRKEDTLYSKIQSRLRRGIIRICKR